MTPLDWTKIHAVLNNGMEVSRPLFILVCYAYLCLQAPHQTQTPAPPQALSVAVSSPQAQGNLVPTTSSRDLDPWRNIDFYKRAGTDDYLMLRVGLKQMRFDEVTVAGSFIQKLDEQRVSLYLQEGRAQYRVHQPSAQFSRSCSLKSPFYSYLHSSPLYTRRRSLATYAANFSNQVYISSNGGQECPLADRPWPRPTAPKPPPFLLRGLQ
jgi:hypothetical protein